MQNKSYKNLHFLSCSTSHQPRRYDKSLYVAVWDFNTYAAQLLTMEGESIVIKIIVQLAAQMYVPEEQIN